MKKAIFFILIAGLAIPGLVKAQSGYTSFQYQIGFGMGDLGDYISKTSFRGAVFDYQKNMTSNISVGLELARIPSMRIWSTALIRMEPFLCQENSFVTAICFPCWPLWSIILFQKGQ